MTFSSLARRAAVLAGAALWSAAPVQAQRDLRIGDFQVRLQTDPITDEDRSLAILYPRDGVATGTGLVSWGCSGSMGELSVGVRLAPGGRGGEAQEVVWRFDADRPDTTVLEGVSGAGSWFLRAEDVVPFTLRTKSATRLVIRVLDGAPAGVTTDYFYDLTGSTNALNRLACARNPRAPRPAASAPPANRRASRKQPADADDAAYELSAVEDVPRPLNVAEIREALRRSYPPTLRDAGVTGTVGVRFRVREDGSVDNGTIRVTRSTLEEFNEPTIQAVRLLRFSPARVNGRPVRVWVELPIEWSVD